MYFVNFVFSETAPAPVTPRSHKISACMVAVICLDRGKMVLHMMDSYKIPLSLQCILPILSFSETDLFNSAERANHFV